VKKSGKKEREKAWKRKKKKGESKSFGNLFYFSERRNAGLSGVKSVGNFSDVHSRAEKKRKN
jgi:hypothetical protein